MMIMTLFDANGLWWFIPQFCRHACHILVRFHRTSFLFNFSENMFLFFFLLSFPKIFPFSSIFTLLSTLFHCSLYVLCTAQTLQLHSLRYPSISSAAPDELYRLLLVLQSFTVYSNLWDFALGFSQSWVNPEAGVHINRGKSKRYMGYLFDELTHQCWLDSKGDIQQQNNLYHLVLATDYVALVVRSLALDMTATFSFSAGGS